MCPRAVCLAAETTRRTGRTTRVPAPDILREATVNQPGPAQEEPAGTPTGREVERLMHNIYRSPTPSPRASTPRTGRSVSSSGTSRAHTPAEVDASMDSFVMDAASRELERRLWKTSPRRAGPRQQTLETAQAARGAQPSSVCSHFTVMYTQHTIARVTWTTALTVILLQQKAESRMSWR